MSRPGSPLRRQRPAIFPKVTSRWLWFGALALFLASGTGGCAQSRPCMIIPAQIELAKAKRDRAKEQYDRRLEEITRSLNNLEASRTRLERLQQERDELKALVPAGGGQ